ncbi:MAG: hypothetical protein K5872_19550 [Rhizobiaceae bacterium]|nr:hypothetical protein [Rhizobiaceae bacterium]MCV0408419.1 hypothetical protein [Rhizobiaceae bacterium]
MRYVRQARSFVALGRPPPYYSDLTFLAGSDTAAALTEVRKLVERQPRVATVKDASCRLDLTGLGFRVLFEASWVRAEADAILPAGDGWQRIETPKDLERWEDAWGRAGSPADQRIFVPDILKSPKIAIFGRPGKAGFSAGCIANLSSDCVGVSNLFGRPLPAVVAAASALSRDFGGGLPLVGYSTGDELTAMLRAGFQQTGPLRVWIR